jgi:hypothetical protein
MGGVIDPDWLGFHIALKVFDSFPVLLILGRHGKSLSRNPRILTFGPPVKVSPATLSATASTSPSLRGPPRMFRTRYSKT